MNVSVPVVALVGCSLLYVLFLLWYGGRGSPMSSAEVEMLLERVRRNAEAADAPLASDLMSSIREVAKDDDGREFVMVNLIRYRTKAAYPPGWDYGDDPHAADARYNRAVVPLLLKRACIPVFLGRSAGRFLAPEGTEPWIALPWCVTAAAATSSVCARTWRKTVPMFTSGRRSRRPRCSPSMPGSA